MSDRDKKADEIVEETMKEIFDDINNSDAFKETDEDNESSKKKKNRKKDADRIDISSHDNHAEAGGYDDVEAVADSDYDEEEFEELLHEMMEEVKADEDIDDDDETDDDEYDENEMDEDMDEDMEEYDDEIDDETDDEIDEDMDERKGRKGRRKKGGKGKKTAAIVIGSVLGVLLLVYVGLAVFFNSHFMFYTKINDTDFSLKSVSQVENYMKQQVADYVLTMEESDGGQEKINGSDISLEYVEGDQLEKLVKKQNNFLWITSLWDHPEIEAEVGVKYAEAALADIIAKLDCMKEENQVASVDAHPEFQDGQFVVVPEVVGTQINTEVFNKKVAEAINGFQQELNLLDSGCYILPRFVSDSQEVVAATDAMNSYLGANVTYDFNPYTEVVDAAAISQWVKVDADMNVTFDEGAVRAYVASLAEKYDTKGKTRTFTSANGNAVTIEGGSYGWRIDQEAEYNALIANIQNAETVTREPNYSSRAASHEGNDVGGTYAEVDLSNQQMYFIQNGQVVLQSGVVTGNPNRGNATPQGVYSLAYKAKDQVLRGTKKPDGTYEYETPVKYWMPFNGGIGFHDANWQSSFGGSRYQTNGSHGCVNLPPSVAAQLYDLISAGTPVVCHF
ncbi:L,D-transpeptidase family protein [Bariatricus sp. SGI.154]|uniref:L,D-transpeptidase family protein n=1 Tax=Bariatricus sp. SGI.154 TaxID=3420549 RepID=UPI003CFF903E